MEPEFDIEKVRRDNGRGAEVHRRRRRKHQGIGWICLRVFAGVSVLCLIAVSFGWCVIASGRQQLLGGRQKSEPMLESVRADAAHGERQEAGEAWSAGSAQEAGAAEAARRAGTAEGAQKAGDAGEADQPQLVEDGTLQYRGVRYRYKEDMINLLLVGVDTSGVMNARKSEKADAKSGSRQQKRSPYGQADAIFLAALDSKEKKLTLIPVNRDTMTEISIYDLYGTYAGRQVEQIALSYAYGDGGELSARLTQDAVSNLFYGLPIHGYCAVNTSVIPIVNDMVGGVEVELMDDLTRWDDSYVKGARVLLDGSMAETYIRKRYDIGDSSNESRMRRQKQYLTAFARKGIRAIRNDMTLPVNLYQTITEYMVTDISVNECSYLASQLLHYTIPDDFIRSIPGSLRQGEVYMEFFVDEKKLYELILDVFYEQVS